MKVIIQVVKEARVKVQKEEISRIGKGYLLYVGIEEGDQEEVVKKMAERIVNIRINKDERGKINKGIKEEGGEMLSVPQFTLCAETKKGDQALQDVQKRKKQGDCMRHLMKR